MCQTRAHGRSQEQADKVLLHEDSFDLAPFAGHFAAIFITTQDAIVKKNVEDS
jgi:hypothetical protein